MEIGGGGLSCGKHVGLLAVMMEKKVLRCVDQSWSRKRRGLCSWASAKGPKEGREVTEEACLPIF